MRVLFIGNSFTARNDLPGLVARLAAAGGHKLDHQLISAGGASLRMHWNRGEAARVIRETPLDVVVLQEQSTLPIKNARRFHENVGLFHQTIAERGARTALYLTWARRSAPESQRALTEAYEAIGRELSATVIPAGIAWERVLQEHPGIVLHDPDGSHPSLAGSYLAACVFYATLFGENPEGLDGGPGELPSADAALLQAAAWSVVSGERPRASRAGCATWDSRCAR